MNPVERTIRRIDATQRRFTPTAFMFGVVKKYGDDNGGVLVANLAYSAFVSIFPLLLVLVAILGLVVAGHPALRAEVLNAAANQVPLLGHTLTGQVHDKLRHSSIIGLIVGLVGLVWGGSQLAQAGLFTMAQVWNLPGPARPGYVQRLGRAGLYLCLNGAGLIVTTLLASLNTYGHKAFGFVILAEVVAATFNAGMFIGSFRVLTPKGVPTTCLVRGAIVGGILWTVLQVVGTYLVHHFLHSNSVYGVFGTVLGLLAWIYLAAEVFVYCAEINVVLARRLWPRAIVQPPLTEADRYVMALEALQNQRRPEQHIEVTFDDRPPDAPEADRTPRTPEEVTPPGGVRVPEQRRQAAAGSPGAEAGSPGAETGSPGAETGSPGAETGSPGAETGSPGAGSRLGRHRVQ